MSIFDDSSGPYTIQPKNCPHFFFVSGRSECAISQRIQVVELRCLNAEAVLNLIDHLLSGHFSEPR